jgi:hypothetical protein
MALTDLKPYSRPSPDGDGLDFDIEAIAVDLICLAKAANISEAQFFFNLRRVWSEIEVEVSPSQEGMN